MLKKCASQPINYRIGTSGDTAHGAGGLKYTTLRQRLQLPIVDIETMDKKLKEDETYRSEFVSKYSSSSKIMYTGAGGKCTKIQIARASY